MGKLAKGMSEDHYIVPYPTRGSVLGTAEIAVLSDVLRSGLPLSAGIYRTIFEQRFAKLIGSRHALSVTSGTVALELAIGVLDLQPGDEVIATPQTYKATVQPLLRSPIKVRFCDVDQDTLNASPACVESLITDRTRAILLVHYGGMPAAMGEIMSIARGRGITVIEDCAHAIGSVYHGRRPGTLADIGCFSFHSSKIISTLGEGGMITLNSDDWAKRVDRIRSNDADTRNEAKPYSIGGLKSAPNWMLHPGDAFTHSCLSIRHPGTNATMSEPSAAVGLAQLDRLDWLVERRREIASRITAALKRYPFVRLINEPPRIRSAYHLFTFFLESDSRLTRDEFVNRMVRQGIEVQLRYFPLHLLPEWRARGHHIGECPVAEEMWFQQQINLPCQPSLSDPQVDILLGALETTLTEAATGRTCLAGFGSGARA